MGAFVSLIKVAKISWMSKFVSLGAIAPLNLGTVLKYNVLGYIQERIVGDNIYVDGQWIMNLIVNKKIVMILMRMSAQIDLFLVSGVNGLMFVTQELVLNR
jgi:hypothetical protein